MIFRPKNVDAGISIKSQQNISKSGLKPIQLKHPAKPILSLSGEIKNWKKRRSGLTMFDGCSFGSGLSDISFRP